MSSDKARLIEARERLRELGARVPERAEGFHRERVALHGEVERALSTLGLLGRGRSAARLAPRVDELAARGQALEDILARVGRIEDRLDLVAQTLGRVADRSPSAPDCIPALLKRLGKDLFPLGRQALTADELAADAQRCDEVDRASTRLSDALDLLLAAESVLTQIRSPARTAPLEVALPELRERLCREGPTPEWRAELKGLLDPLAALARREQPREIRETEKIVRDLARWAKLLGVDCDACAGLATRFMSKRKDWPGEDDRTFRELFEQARGLEREMLARAETLRRGETDDLEARYRLLAELVGPDAGIEAQIRDLRQESPEDPRDHEDWCEELDRVKGGFAARVKRSETELLDRLGLHLADCRKRLDAASAIPRLDEKDERLAGLRDALAELGRSGTSGDGLRLLAEVERARILSGELQALEALILADNAGLDEERARIAERARRIAERAQGLGIALPAPLPDAGRLAHRGGRQTSLQQERRQLERDARLLGEAEAQFAGLCGAELERVNRRIGRILEILSSERARSAAPDPARVEPADRDDPLALADGLDAARACLAACEPLLADEEQAQSLRLAELRQGLAALPAERLGPTDRGERAQALRDLERWDPARIADPIDRLEALRDLIEAAQHPLRRFATAARRLGERRQGLMERLRRFDSLFLRGYCPELYLRVEALVHPPEGTRWPGDAQAHQLREAERLIALLERQAHRLAAREVAEHVQALERQAQRADDAQARSVVEEVRALAPERPPPAHLRRRLAELAEPHLDRR